MAVRTKEQVRTDNETRLRRAKAWMARAQAADSERKRAPMSDWIDDSAVRFVFWWIALEAACGDEKTDGWFKSFIGRFLDSKERKKSVGKMLDEHREDAREIMYLRQTHDGFWINRLKEPAADERVYKDAEDWVERFLKQQRNYDSDQTPLSSKLRILISRLRVVRNQIFHGANSRNGSRGLTQTRSGAKLLSVFVPYFIKEMEAEMKARPNRHWGAVPFPRYGGIDQQNLPPIWADENK